MIFFGSRSWVITPGRQLVLRGPPPRAVARGVHSSAVNNSVKIGASNKLRLKSGKIGGSLPRAAARGVHGSAAGVRRAARLFQLGDAGPGRSAGRRASLAVGQDLLQHAI